MNNIEAKRIFQHLEAVMIQKHQDYGPRNISDAFGGPMNGLLVRIGDKYARIKHLTKAKEGQANFESLEDSFLDLANYCVIAILVMRGKWEE